MSTISPTVRSARWALVATGIALILGLAWLGSRSDDLRKAYSVTGEKTDYYSLLVHGLSKGHLYMEVAVDPRYTSADPKEQRKADWLLDASLYKGHYYLYFGIVPAAVLLLPYHLATGSDLSENTAVLVMVMGALLVYWRIFEQARQRYFPTLTPGQYAATLALFALGSGAPMLLTYAGFYEIAVSAGYFCHALMWLGVFKALHEPEKAGRWLALASLAGGLAVGCRPNYIIVLPVVLVAAGLLRGKGIAARSLLIWSVGPAAVVGAALAIHNYARFESPVEFGLGYQLDEMIRAKFPLFSLTFFWSNLQWYFLRPPALSPFFPYVFPMNADKRPDGYYGYETIHGQLPITVLGVVVLAWLLLATHRRPLERNAKALMGLLGAGFGILFLAMAFYSNRAERYTVDFQASLVLLIGLAAGFASCREMPAPRASPRSWRLAFIGISLAASLSNVLASMQLNERFEHLHPGTWKALTYWGNYPSAILGRMGLFHFGPVRFSFVIPPQRGDVTKTPLLATGLPNQTDILYLTQVHGNVIEYSVSHTGFGEVRSGLMQAAPGSLHQVEVDFGSLYPPRDHPWFHGMSDDDIEILKTTASVRVDNQVVIDRRVLFFDSPPGWVHFGQNPGGIDPPFEGTITGTALLPARRPEELLERSHESGVWRLRVTFPFEAPLVEQPVLGSGTARHGNMLLLRTLESHAVQFSLDQWGLSILRSPAIYVDGDGSHTLELFVGGQAARSSLTNEWKIDRSLLDNAEPFLRVWLDGKPVWITRITLNRDSYRSVAIGSNPQRFSSASSYYRGDIESEFLSPEETRGLIEKNIAQGDGIPGLFRYQVEFPEAPLRAGLPLLGVGVAGDGNLLYARADPQGRYHIGIDDWGLAAAEGPAFSVGRGPHVLEIVLGPLVERGAPAGWCPPGALAGIRRRFIVFVDGMRVGDFVVSHHLSAMGTLTPGSNPQGFSTATPEFLGPLFGPEPMLESQARELIARCSAPR